MPTTWPVVSAVGVVVGVVVVVASHPAVQTQEKIDHGQFSPLGQHQKLGLKKLK